MSDQKEFNDSASIPLNQKNQSQHLTNSFKQQESQLRYEKKVDGKIELTEEEGYDATGYAFSNFKKWSILTVFAHVFVINSS